MSKNNLFALPRWGALAVGAGIVFIFILLTTGDMLGAVIVGDACDGLILFAWLAAALGIGRLLPLPLRERVGGGVLYSDGATSFRLPLTPPSPARGEGEEIDSLLRLTAAVGIGLGVIGLVVLALGIAGLLNRLTAITLIVGGLFCLGWSYRHKQLADVGRWLTSKSIDNSLAVLLFFPLAIAVIAASLFPGLLWKPLDPHPYDVMSYHLQIPREWFELGRIVPLHHNAFSYFPMGLEMHDLLAMHLLGGPWAAMYLCQFMSVAFGGLTVLAVVGAARQFGVPSVIAWLSGLLVACVPWTTMLSSVCYVEPAVMLYTLLAVTWAMIGLTGVGDGPRSMMVRAMTVAGISAGLACDIKYTPIAMTALPVFALWPIAAWRTRVRHWFRPWLIGCICFVLTASPWLVRNVIWTGNPVFPLMPTALGAGHFTPDQIDRYRLAHEPPPAERSISARTTAGFGRVMIDPQCGYLFPWLTLASMAWLTIKRRFLLLTALTATMAAIWLLATHDEPRFLTPVIPLAAVIIALALPRHRFARWFGGGTLILQSIIGLVWTWQTLSPTLDLGRQGFLRLANVSNITSPELLPALRSNGPIALIGDAQAFYYGTDSGRLLYRNVFDVNIPPGISTADGWLGKSVEQLRSEGYWVVVNTDELARLSRTYAHIPPPTPPYDAVGVEPIILPPTRNQAAVR